MDCQVAWDLAGEVYSEKAFEPIGEAVFQGALQKLKACGAVVNCLRGYCAMNEKKRQLAETAAALELPVVKRADLL